MDSKAALITPSFLLGKQLHKIHNILYLQQGTLKNRFNIIFATRGMRRVNHSMDPPALPKAPSHSVMHEILDVYLPNI